MEPSLDNKILSPSGETAMAQPRISRIIDHDSVSQSCILILKDTVSKLVRLHAKYLPPGEKVADRRDSEGRARFMVFVEPSAPKSKMYMSAVLESDRNSVPSGEIEEAIYSSEP